MITFFFPGIIVRNTLVVYDRENNKIGFWKTNCSELWKRLQETGVPAPGDIVPQSRNTSSVLPPSEAPGALPTSDIAGKLLSDNC